MLATTACPITDSWAKLQKMVYRVAHNHLRKHKGDPEEVFAEARLHFMRAYRTWTPLRGRMTTWVYTKVHYGLLTAKAMAAKTAIAAPPEDADLQKLPSPEGGHWSNSVSGDARTVAELALKAGTGKRSKARRFVIGVLKDLGWTMARIVESFSEIREALS